MRSYKNNHFVININQRPNNSVSTSESREVNFYPDMRVEQFDASSSNEKYEVNVFQAGFG